MWSCSDEICTGFPHRNPSLASSSVFLMTEKGRVLLTASSEVAPGCRVREGKARRYLLTRAASAAGRPESRLAVAGLKGTEHRRPPVPPRAAGERPPLRRKKGRGVGEAAPGRGVPARMRGHRLPARTWQAARQPRVLRARGVAHAQCTTASPPAMREEVR